LTGKAEVHLASSDTRQSREPDFALLASPLERIGIAASFVAATLLALAIQCCSLCLTHRLR
jgi:hypothetical protein